MKIWCLFSVENNYDQPENNLVAWWREKPTLSMLQEATGMPDDLQALWNGQEVRDEFHCTFRLTEVKEGLLP